MEKKVEESQIQTTGLPVQEGNLENWCSRIGVTKPLPGAKICLQTLFQVLFEIFQEIYANPVIRVYRYWDKVFKVPGPKPNRKKSKQSVTII